MTDSLLPLRGSDVQVPFHTLPMVTTEVDAHLTLPGDGEVTWGPVIREQVAAGQVGKPAAQGL